MRWAFHSVKKSFSTSTHGKDFLFLHMNNQKTGSNKIIRQGHLLLFAKVGLSKNKAFQQAGKPAVRQAFCHPGSAPGAGSGLNKSEKLHTPLMPTRI